MSNNPPLPEPPPDMSDFQTEVIHEGWPAKKSRYPVDTNDLTLVDAHKSKPRRAQQRPSLLSREDWGTAIILGAIFSILSFASGWLGAVLAGAW